VVAHPNTDHIRVLAVRELELACCLFEASSCACMIEIHSLVVDLIPIWFALAHIVVFRIPYGKGAASSGEHERCRSHTCLAHQQQLRLD
jgi:hypothetical protein